MNDAVKIETEVMETKLVNGYIECYGGSVIVKYDFSVNRDKVIKLARDYSSASHAELPFFIACSNGGIIAISGQSLRLSTLCFCEGATNE